MAHQSRARARESRARTETEEVTPDRARKAASETIAAIATAPGRAGIGIVRVSGPASTAAARAITGRGLEPRHATHVRFYDADGRMLDEGVAIYFQAPYSYTGEDVLELQGHGGAAVLRLVLQRCVELGARLAKAGEFTERAFLNGKMDLAQAEAVVDLIDAATGHAARCAARSVAGEFSARIGALAASMIALRAAIEATIDFTDEDVPSLTRDQIEARLTSLRARIETIIEEARRGTVLREGLSIALAGPPNVGKSSLMNQLAGKDLAIVTSLPGTTRDPIRQVVDLNGVPAEIVDTAGLRDSDDVIERIGVERAWQTIEEADAVIQMHDATLGSEADTELTRKLPANVPRLRVINKIDLVALPARRSAAGDVQTIWLSAKTGEGVSLLRDAIAELADWGGDPESVFLARDRHLFALRAAQSHLLSAAATIDTTELVAEELRLAHDRLSEITGEYTSDDLLGEIFSRFCIGK